MKVEDSITNYFSYVRTVLGVRSLQSAISVAGIQCDLLFINLRSPQEPSVFDTEPNELVNKMIQAMRLSTKTHHVHEVDLPEGKFKIPAMLQEISGVARAPFTVVFSSKPAHNGLIQNLGTQKYLETFGPAFLQKNSAAKKVAWADLQKVMKELGVK
jgi:hypothetical protein